MLDTRGPTALWSATSSLPSSVSLTRLAAEPRVALGTWPTPIQRLDRDGPVEIMVKRDDLSGWGRGGAKARKIEHLVGRLLAGRHDELVAVVGNVTNLAFDLLPALDRHGIRATLLIADDPPASPETREAIFAGVQGRVVLLPASRCAVARRALGAWRAARARGGRPFLALPGVSHPAGVVGNALGFLEMAEQLRAAGRPLPDVVHVAAATGTTTAGFLIAARALEAAGERAVRIVGTQVYPGPMRLWTRSLVRWTERRLRLSPRVPADRVVIDDTALGGGFGRFTPEVAELCERVREEAGFAIDPFFSGKAWSVLERRLEMERRGSVLFWHCGVTPEWRILARGIGTAA